MTDDVDNRFKQLLDRFIYASDDDIWPIRIEANAFLLDLEYRALVTAGALSADEADQMKRQCMTRIYRFYSAMRD